MAVDILMSYAFHKNADLGAVREALGPDQRLMIDSGAFTAFTSGKPIKLEEYAAYLKHWEGAWDYAMSLDVIGDPKGTAKNLAALEALGVPVLPVYTAKAGMAELRALARDHDYVAYGGLVGVPKALQIPATAKVVAEAAKFGTKVHALGQTGAPMFRATNVYSGDSSAASRAPLNFQVPIFNPAKRKLESLQFGKKSLWAESPALLRAYGLNARECVTGDAMRSKGGRIPVYRAGCLAVAAMSVDLRGDNNQPRVYSAVTTTEVLAGAMLAATDWREGNLPHPLNRLTPTQQPIK